MDSRHRVVGNLPIWYASQHRAGKPLVCSHSAQSRVRRLLYHSWLFIACYWISNYFLHRASKIKFAMKQQQPAPAPPLDGAKPIPPLVKLILNLVIVAAVAAFFMTTGTSVLLTCAPPVVSAASLAIILWLIIHLCWPYLGKPIKKFGEELKADGGLKPIIQLLTALADLLLSWELPDRTLLGLRALAVVIVATVWGSDLGGFPILSVSEETPRLQSFSVYYLDRAPQTHMPGDTVEIRYEQHVSVEAKTLPARVLCTWSSAAKGSLPPEPGCSAQYNALLGGVDILTVQVQSMCKTKSIFASLNIRIVQP